MRNAAFAALACAALLCMPAAFAQAPAGANTQAKELAERLGREKNAEGLETIIKSGNVDLVEAWLRGLRATGAALSSSQGYKASPLPADLEALAVRYYADPVVGPRLTGICGDNGWRCQTRALFDLMLAEWRSGKPRGSGLRDAVLHSDAPGAEEALVAWLGAPDAPKGDGLNGTVSELGRRKSARAVPALAALLAQAPPGQAGNLNGALASIGTPAAVDALIARMGKLKGSSDAASVAEIRSIASQLAQTGPEVALPYERLRAVLPPDERQYAISWLQKRKDLKAVPDTLVMLGDQSRYGDALNALIATDSPEVWKQARAAVEKLKQENRINEGFYLHAKSTLDAKIADPGKHMAEKATIARGREFETHRELLARDRDAARKLRSTSPDAYISAMRDYFKAVDQLIADFPDLRIVEGTKQTMGADALEAGQWLRFRMKRPKDALEFFAVAQRSGPYFGQLGQFAIADTWQFDLRDRNRALAEYRKLAMPNASSGAGGSDAEPMVQWARRWLAAQEAYLAKGTKFSGPIGEADIGGVAMVAMYGGGGSNAFDLGPLLESMGRAQRGEKPVDREAVRRALDALPPSGFVLAQTIPLVSYLPDAASILAYLDRHDPAGFTSASYFGLVEFLSHSPGREAAGLLPGFNASAARDPLNEAKARFARERRVDLAAIAKQAKPDPRFSTPAETWNLFIKSLRSADLETALSCLTPELQARFKPLFAGMKPAELREMADSFKGFAVTTRYGEVQEAMVTRKDGHGGIVSFMNARGNWKIAEM